MPIVLAALNILLTITKINLDEKTKRHFENLGILKGSQIMVISNSGGDLIVKVKDSKIAIDKNTAMKIFVA